MLEQGHNKSVFFSLLTKCTAQEVLRVIKFIIILSQGGSNDNDNDSVKKDYLNPSHSITGKTKNKR